ncbi:MAG: hypothetical protein WCJ58_01110 [bacterium]
MSGKSSGNALMTVAAISAIALTGGAAAGIVAPALLGAGLVGAAPAVASGYAMKTAAKATENAKKLQGSLLKPISTPQVAPTPDSATVQAQRANTLTQLQQRSGRASTLLTNQFGG